MKTLFKNSKIIVITIDFLLISFTFFGKFIAELMIKYIPNCPFRNYGLLCPSCGGTRAVYLIFNGNFIVAFNYNQYFFLLAFYIIAVIIFANIGYLFRIKAAEAIFKKITNYKIIISLAVLWLIFGIFRNLFLNTPLL
ncbi:MAG: DUF2752 domain-containing protein [Clostridia bacterium]|nr:DUF2752 domain-containing protein [Clostridia bacterium]